VTRLCLGCLILIRSLIYTSSRRGTFFIRSKINHASLSRVHGANHLSQVPWREVEGHLSPECGCAVPTSNELCVQTRFKIRSRHCADAFSLQVPKSCTDLNPTLLCTLIFRTHTKFVRENKMLALGVCFPQPCSSAGCRFAVSRSRLN